MTKSDHERRWDKYGEFRLIVRAERYVMFRRKGGEAQVMTENEWNKMARTPEEVGSTRWNGTLRVIEGDKPQNL